MHQTRQQTTTRLPISRKGTKYIVRALDHHNNAVPVLMALRDMLKVARTAKEVNEMLKDKLIKVNNIIVTDNRHSIKLFNVLQADKAYFLTLSFNGKYIFEETKDSSIRLCKVINKTILKNKITQINFHDGTNMLTKDKLNVGDSVYIDNSRKIKKIISLTKGAEVLVIAGKYSGTRGKISEIVDGKFSVSFKGGNVLFDKLSIIAL
ncbi:hypothetical protein COU54_02560 [Candidatus Pacearchaeota archaeon CG10_big_fil_rev_8_21_14_0_10_31_24]|nr:MAG: hypothetical protein COU54_02560 [Candidatus Pacearchaeota archaeon CG10_big_fil_rev_8_21_14_0_10_31_24]